MKRLLVCALGIFFTVQAQNFFDEETPQRAIQLLMVSANKKPEEVVLSTVRQVIASNKHSFTLQAIFSGLGGLAFSTALLVWAHLYGLYAVQDVFALLGFTAGAYACAVLMMRYYSDAQWLREIQRLLEVPEMGKLILKLLHYAYEHEEAQGNMAI